MRIQHNIMAMNAYRNYNNNTSALSKNLEKLSSGYKINRAGDDAAGLAISEKMRAQITGLETAQKNAKDGISLVQTAEGALTEVHDMLNRMVELATQSANGTYDNSTDRAQLQKEVEALKSEIDRIADSANFNGINLLDGTQAGQDLTTDGVTDVEQLLTKGITIDPAKGGGGSKGEYTIDVTNLFGAGDELKVEFQLPSGSTATAPADATLTYGTDFKGNTAEEQAKSIADALSKKADIVKAYDVTVDGTKVVLTNKKEGSDQPQVKGFTLTDKKTTVDTANTKATATAADGTGATIAFSKLFDGTSTGSLAVDAGDVLNIELTDGNGNIWKASLTITADMTSSGNTKDITAAIASALGEVTFEDIEGTAADESSFKVSDLFAVTPNGTDTGDFSLVGKAGTEGFTAGTIRTDKTAAVNATVSGAAVGTAGEYTLKMDTGEAANFTVGDKIKLEGELSDGRTFEIELEAGKDFEIGTDLQGTMNNLKTQLETVGMDITVKDDEGKTSVINSKNIFGTGKEITITTTTDGATFESTVSSATNAGNITGISVTATATSTESNLLNGIQQTAAESTITFDDKLQYGATVDIGGLTYEIVKDADSLTNKTNQAVIVSDLTDSKAVAQALADKINTNIPKDDKGDPTFSVKTSGSTVTVTTTAKGSDVAAIDISTDGDTTYSKTFTLDPSKIKEGSYVTINGNTYEFVAEGNKPTTKGAIGVTIKDNAKDLAQELANVADGKNGSVKVDENGVVTVKAADTSEKPQVEFFDGLTLQIGDTADDFNQLSVSIEDMHAKSIGIGDIDISTQKGAKEAVDIIKDAINKVSDVRGSLGATQNRLDHTINNLSVMTENIQDAESSIRDTDIAEEMMAYTKNNILVQSAQAMLAQANQVPQGVLQLLG